MIAPARKLAFQVLSRIEQLGKFSDYELNSKAVGRLERRDRNLTMEIVLGTLRWQGLLDFLLAATVSRPSLDDVYLQYTGRSFDEADQEASR